MSFPGYAPSSQEAKEGILRKSLIRQIVIPGGEMAVMHGTVSIQLYDMKTTTMLFMSPNSLLVGQLEGTYMFL